MRVDKLTFHHPMAENNSFHFTRKEFVQIEKFEYKKLKVEELFCEQRILFSIRSCLETHSSYSKEGWDRSVKNVFEYNMMLREN